MDPGGPLFTFTLKFLSYTCRPIFLITVKLLEKIAKNLNFDHFRSQRGLQNMAPKGHDFYTPEGIVDMPINPVVFLEKAQTFNFDLFQHFSG